MLKNISRVSGGKEWILCQHEKRNSISPGGPVMFSLLNTNEIPNHFNFATKGVIHHVTTAMVIFSVVKITLFSRVNVLNVVCFYSLIIVSIKFSEWKISTQYIISCYPEVQINWVHKNSLQAYCLQRSYVGRATFKVIANIFV